MAALPEFKWTQEKYLNFERESEEKHEYLNGEIVALAGASPNHNQILGNTLASLHTQLRTGPCIVYPSDMRLKVTKTGLYTYPDISVVCGSPQFDDESNDSLLNPTVLIEVLSPSTENYDRGKKFRHYRTIVSLHEYILIAQDNIEIEQFVRQADGNWLLHEISQSEASLELPSIGCILRAEDIYLKVTFEEEK